MHRKNGQRSCNGMNFWYVWQHIMYDKVRTNTAIWIRIPQMYFNGTAKSVSTTRSKPFFVFCDNEEIWSDLPFPFFTPIIPFTFLIKIHGWKAIYWQKRNKHSQSSSSAHYSSPKPAGLQRNAEQLKKEKRERENKKGVLPCLCLRTSVRARWCVSSEVQPCVLQLLSIILGLYQLPTGLWKTSHLN